MQKNILDYFPDTMEKFGALFGSTAIPVTKDTDVRLGDVFCSYTKILSDLNYFDRFVRLVKDDDFDSYHLHPWETRDRQSVIDEIKRTYRDGIPADRMAHILKQRPSIGIICNMSDMREAFSVNRIANFNLDKNAWWTKSELTFIIPGILHKLKD